MRAGHPGWVALALHLSRLTAPAPRPHHRRIARAMLDDAAVRHEGQFFPLGNGDMVLLCRAADAGSGLAGALARLFQADAPDPEMLLTRWLLPGEAQPFLAYVDFSEQEAAARPPPPMTETLGSPSALEVMSGLVDTGRVTDMLHRQTAILFPAGKARVEPLYREMTFSMAALEARAQAGGHATSDPFLFRHLASRLDRPHAPNPFGGPPRPRRPVRLGLRGRAEVACEPDALGHPLARLRRLRRRVPHSRREDRGGDCPLLDACADPDAFLLARERLREAGFALVLDAVSHQALLITSPWVLEPDLLKLEWSRQVPGGGDALDAALAKVGRSRIVLQRADTEEALRWGLGHGIRRFQGRHVDAILAASRVEACPHAASCTLRQCMEREFATSPAGRSGCRNLGLLDTAVPVLERVA